MYVLSFVNREIHVYARSCKRLRFGYPVNIVFDSAFVDPALLLNTNMEKEISGFFFFESYLGLFLSSLGFFACL